MEIKISPAAVMLSALNLLMKIFGVYWLWNAWISCNQVRVCVLQSFKQKHCKIACLLGRQARDLDEFDYQVHLLARVVT